MNPEEASPPLDARKPSIARVYDYWLGGKDNFAADRDEAERMLAVYPELPQRVRENRRFLGLAVNWLAGTGITQFLDLGSGLPTAYNTHEAAQSAQPDARVVYVDNDPMVVSHARALLQGRNVVALAGDIADPAAVLAQPEVRELIRPDEPVAVIFAGVLHFFGAETAEHIVAAFMEPAAPGSYVIASVGWNDDTVEQQLAREYSAGAYRNHGPDQFRRFFAGLDLIEPPGIADARHGAPGQPAPSVRDHVRVLAAVARKPLPRLPTPPLADVLCRPRAGTLGPLVPARGLIVMFVPIADTPWEDADNARRYAEFARRYPMYRLTSEHLVGLAVLAPDARVVDLCCGTGVTTEAVLAALGARGSVVAVDSAAAMLAEARSRVVDERVTWVRGQAENLTAGTASAVDAVLCNQAFWQTDMPAAAVAVRGVLRPGGRLVFNVAAQMLADRPEARTSPDPLIVRLREAAAREHGWPASAPRGERPPGGRLSEGAIRDLLARAGLRVDEVRELRWEQSLEERYAWLTVPVFARRVLDGLPYPECMMLLAKAYRDIAVVHPEPRTATALAFAATVEHASA